MKPLDRLLQRWRIEQARRHIPRDAYVLDIGCADGALFRVLGRQIRGGVGIDPDAPSTSPQGVRFVRGRFPGDLRDDGPFDAAAALAVFEHLDERTQRATAERLAQLLRPGATLVLTVPAPLVDRIVHALARVRLVEGMALHEHRGFDAAGTPERFAGLPFDLVRHERFQLGLNNLFVFRRR